MWPVSLPIINSMLQVGQVCIVSVLLYWRQQNRGAGVQAPLPDTSQPTSQRRVHSAHLPSPDLALLEGVWFCVLSPALILTFRKVSQEAGSVFWAFLLLTYPIITAEVPQGTRLEVDSSSCAPSPHSNAFSLSSPPLSSYHS